MLSYMLFNLSLFFSFKISFFFYNFLLYIIKDRKMLNSVLMTLVKQPKQVTFYKMWYNYYLIKSQNLYFHDKFSIYSFLNHCR